MKKTAVCLLVFSSTLLCKTTLVQAVEQKIIFNTERIEYKSGTGAKRCQEKCNRISGPDTQSFLSEGWKIVSSSPKVIIGEDYRYVPCPSCQPHGCNCIGTEYLLQKDEPALKVETPNNKLEALDKNRRSESYTPKVEASSNELNRLKNENVLLKQEIIELKQEIEKIKNQIKSNR